MSWLFNHRLKKDYLLFYINNKQHSKNTTIQVFGLNVVFDMAADLALKNVDNACETAEEFTRLFYKHLDNSRHLTSKLYLDAGLLVWNGNGINGNAKIQKFLLDLPPSSHYVKTLDAQPVSENFMPDNLTYLIQACGDVTYQNDDVKKPFQETFVIVAVEGKWKIATDCYRLQVPYNCS